jgi:hypothetical protein
MKVRDYSFRGVLARGDLTALLYDLPEDAKLLQIYPDVMTDRKILRFSSEEFEEIDIMAGEKPNVIEIDDLLSG